MTCSQNFFRADGKNFRDLRVTPPFAAKPPGSGFSLFRAHRYRCVRNSPSSVTLFAKRKGHEQGSRKSQRSEIFGKRRSGVRTRALPLGAKRERSRLLRREGVFPKAWLWNAQEIIEKYNNLCRHERTGRLCLHRKTTHAFEMTQGHTPLCGGAVEK